MVLKAVGWVKRLGQQHWQQQLPGGDGTWLIVVYGSLDTMNDTDEVLGHYFALMAVVQGLWLESFLNGVNGEHRQTINHLVRVASSLPTTSPAVHRVAAAADC